MGNIIEFKNTGQRAQLREAQQKQNWSGFGVATWNTAASAATSVAWAASFSFSGWSATVISYDGMYMMRHRDISELESPDKHRVFLEKALALKHILPHRHADSRWTTSAK